MADQDGTQQALEAIHDTVDSLCAKFANMTMTHPNEYGLNNNCVFLSIAHLLGKTLSDYLTDTEQMQPNYAADTPSLQKVAAMLNETGKQIFTYSVQNAAEFKFRTYAENSPVDRWGVLFLRTDGSGHCIVFEQGEFRDYQPDPVQTITGAEADEIESQIVYVFSISESDVTEAPAEDAGAGADAGAGDGRSPKDMDIDEPAEEEPAEDNQMEIHPEDDEMEDGTNQE